MVRPTQSRLGRQTLVSEKVNLMLALGYEKFYITSNIITGMQKLKPTFQHQNM
jgi:hypothetical protein